MTYLKTCTVDTLTSNGLMLEQLVTQTKQFDENPILKHTHARTHTELRDHVGVTWSPLSAPLCLSSLSAALLGRTHSYSWSFADLRALRWKMR